MLIRGSCHFGTRTAHFHVWGSCGVVPFVTSDIDGPRYAVVSVNAFDGHPARVDTVGPRSRE